MTKSDLSPAAAPDAGAPQGTVATFIRLVREEALRLTRTYPRQTMTTAIHEAFERIASEPRPDAGAPQERLAHYPIRAHVEGCPKTLRVPVDLCDCGGRDFTPSAPARAHHESK